MPATNHITRTDSETAQTPALHRSSGSEAANLPSVERRLTGTPGSLREIHVWAVRSRHGNKPCYAAAGSPA